MGSGLSLALVSTVTLLAQLTCACGQDPPPAAPAPLLPSSAAGDTRPAAADPPRPTKGAKPSLADLEKQDIATALAGLNAHDPKKFASVYAENAVISVAGLNEIDGRDAVAQNMAEWFEVFSRAKLGFSRVWAKGEVLVLEWVINGTHHGELFGVKGTEAPIGHYGLSVVTFDGEGKVARENRYGELGSVMAQVGSGGANAAARPIPDIPPSPETFVGAGDDKNIDIARSALAALEGKKEDAFTSVLTEDVEQDGLFAFETSKGRAGAQKFYKAFTTAFPDAKFDVTRAVAVGDYAILESTLSATQNGPLGTIAATKRPITVHLADIFRIKEGRIARAWTYQNSLEMQQQLGLFSVKK